MNDQDDQSEDFQMKLLKEMIAGERWAIRRFIEERAKSYCDIPSAKIDEVLSRLAADIENGIHHLT